MRFFPRLWQQVFMYAILLIIASQVVSFIIFHQNINESMHKRVLEELAISGAESLEGKDEDEAWTLAHFFQTSHRSLWVEGANGQVIAGEARPDFSYDMRVAFPFAGISRNHVLFMETGNSEAPYLATVPVNLLGGRAMLCLYMETMPPPANVGPFSARTNRCLPDWRSAEHVGGLAYCQTAAQTSHRGAGNSRRQP